MIIIMLQLSKLKHICHVLNAKNDCLRERIHLTYNYPQQIIWYRNKIFYQYMVVATPGYTLKDFKTQKSKFVIFIKV